MLVEFSQKMTLTQNSNWEVIWEVSAREKRSGTGGKERGQWTWRGCCYGNLGSSPWGSLGDLMEHDSEWSHPGGEEPGLFIHQLPVVTGWGLLLGASASLCSPQHPSLGSDKVLEPKGAGACSKKAISELENADCLRQCLVLTPNWMFYPAIHNFNKHLYSPWCVYSFSPLILAIAQIGTCRLIIIHTLWMGKPSPRLICPEFSWDGSSSVLTPRVVTHAWLLGFLQSSAP